MPTATAPAGAGGSPRNILIHLHNNDLRLHDSPVLAHAHGPHSSHITHFLPIYVFDERVVALAHVPGFTPATAQGKAGPRSRLGSFWRVGRHRARFLVEAVMDLKSRYRARGGDMVVACGRPERVVSEIVQALLKEGDKVEGVWLQKEVTVEEVNMMRRLRDSLEEHDVDVTLVNTKTLINEEDLPFKIDETPNVYTSFRKAVEGLGEDMVRDPLPVPEKIKPCPPKPSLDGTFILPPALCTAPALLPYILAPLIAEPDIGDPTKPVPVPTSEAEWSAYRIPDIEKRSAFPFHGGESTGLARVDDYLGSQKGGKAGKGEGGSKAMSYKDTRNGMVGEAFSTKFSAWLAHGCLSGRYLGWRVRELQDRLRAERALTKHVENNVYWILFELLWRDFFYFTSERFSHLPAYSKGNRGRKSASTSRPGEAGTASTLFNLGGFEEVLKPQESQRKIHDWRKFDLSNKNDGARRFLEGRTGLPFVDANMRELAQTGFMSNRGRQNVASFLTVDLYIDWRIGAEWFETFLIDHDVCSNWGNWQYQAGVGNDPRASRQFNQIKQANDYDPDNTFVRTWLPELGQVPDDLVQSPWLMKADQKEAHGVGSRDDQYPGKPMLEQQQWKKHYRTNTHKPRR